jgi:peptidoglycan hydrolase FlgJ
VTSPLLPGQLPGTSQPTVSTDTTRLATRENLEQAGARFESVFIGMMLKSMRQARLAEGLFDSKAADQFRDMADQKLAQNMAVHTPMGIGKAMTEFLSRSQPQLAETPKAGEP